MFNVGAVGIDNINKLNLLDRTEFEKSIGFNLGKRNLLITFHPVTLETKTAEDQFSNLLSVLDELKDTHFIFTKANADTDGRIINTMIDDYVSGREEIAVTFTSLGQLRYLSAMKHIDGVVGNSSSGIIEAPSFKIGTINIGNRQKGRIKGQSVIDATPTMGGIRKSIEKLYSTAFQERLAKTITPYGQGKASKKIKEIISQTSQSISAHKVFFDLNIERCIQND